MDGYLKLLKQEKNNRLNHIISQTNKYLKTLGEKIKVQKDENASRTKGVSLDGNMIEEKKADSEKNEDEDDGNAEDLMQESKAYSNLAHTHQEEINEQP